ncbi:MAG: hypothetical protein NUV42_01700 [Candidatus Yonathbacteria bacterium]|nr:hypothetical protein [Candidatus Yonathbacteria bacterium]
MGNKETISFEDFSKLDIRIGTITSAEKMADTDRLIRLSVDLGEEKERQIISGVAEHFPEPQALVGKQVPVLANLPPRTIKGIVSEGMILYVVSSDLVTALTPLRGDVPPGTPVK